MFEIDWIWWISDEELEKNLTEHKIDLIQCFQIRNEKEEVSFASMGERESDVEVSTIVSQVL